MTIYVDTSILIDAFSSPERRRALLDPPTARGHRLILSAIVLYEWQRRPRLAAETELLDIVFPVAERTVFGLEEAATAAQLYRAVKKPRTREMDIAIAACAIEDNAALWTLNEPDFEDLPGLTLYRG